MLYYEYHEKDTNRMEIASENHRGQVGTWNVFSFMFALARAFRALELRRHLAFWW